MRIVKKQLSLRGLRTFCAAARHRSFRVAAEELFVTASAVSHGIKTLEQELGITLFDRTKRGLSLTDAGKALYDDVHPLIDELDRVTAPYCAGQRRISLRLSVQPFFASEMLVPRLAEFTQAHPDIDISIDTDDETSATLPGSADVSIRLFRSAPKGMASDAFFPLRLVAACSPSLRDELMKGDDGMPEAFPAIVHSRRTGDWEHWAEQTGLELPEPKSIVQLSTMVAVVRAAEQSLGVALVPMPLCQSRFDAGQLVPLIGPEVVTPDRYYFVCERKRRNEWAIQALRKWVLQTFAPLA